jgi:glycosyltransferase involved in cell wall biosynthesis
MTANHRLSIVISTYNCAGTLQACLDSIFEQTYPGIEIVIADGGSTDGTLAVIEANSARIGAWKSAPDSGIYDAWNTALKMVTGDWVSFLGADDTLDSPDCIARAMAALSDVPETTMIAYGSILLVRGNGSGVELGTPWPEARRRIHAEMSIPHPGTFHRRQLFDRLGGFDTRLQIAGDYKLIAQSLELAEPVFLDGVRVVSMQAGGKSELRRNRVAALLEVRRVQAELGYRISPLWVWAMAKGVAWFVLTRAAEFPQRAGLVREKRHQS